MVFQFLYREVFERALRHAYLFSRRKFFLFQSVLLIAWIYVGMVEVSLENFFAMFSLISFVFGNWFFTHWVPCIGWIMDLVFWALWPVTIAVMYECMKLIPESWQYFICSCMWMFFTVIYVCRYMWKVFKIFWENESRLWW